MPDTPTPDPNGEVQVTLDGPVATLTLSRPARRNALSVAMCRRFTETLTEVAADPAVRVVLLTGEEPAFCAGADFGDFESGPDRGGFVPEFHVLLDTIAHLRVPVVAYVNGPALGAGCQVVCQCDLRLAAESATVGIPAAKVGLMLDAQNTVRLVNEVGPATARRLLLTGEALDAQEALRLGVVHRVVDDEVAATEARLWAELVASRAPLSVQGHKAAVQAVVDGWHMPVQDASYAEIQQQSLAAFASEDLREGLSAFGEKRQPRFQGR